MWEGIHKNIYFNQPNQNIKNNAVQIVWLKESDPPLFLPVYGTGIVLNERWYPYSQEKIYDTVEIPPFLLLNFKPLNVPRNI